MSRHLVVMSYRDMEHPEAGGAEVIMFEVFRRLRAQGHRVTFVTGGFAGAPAHTTLDGMDVHRVGNQYTFNWAGPRHYRHLVQTERVDAVIEDINKIPFFTPRHVPGVPTVAVVPHLFGTTVFAEASWPIAAYVYLHEQLIPSVYRRCPFSVLSETTRDDLLARGIAAERIHVIHPGLDLEAHPLRAAGHTPPTRPVITYLGRVKRYKGIDLVIRALPTIQTRVPDVRYWIVGEGDHAEALRRIAGEVGVSDAVEFLGFKAGAEKARVLEETRVLAYTSPKEGFGLSVIEAGAVGVPTVASNSPGLRESVRDGVTGLLCPHGDVPALAGALTTLLADDPTWERFSRAARAWAERFSWDRMADETLSLVESAITEGRGRTAGVP
jgi:glycosyltransferase involved in cell wall biosynthesis